MKTIFLLLVLLVSTVSLKAQCAMCKTTIVNNVSNGELSLAEGLNFGIMYLFTTPYLVILLIGFLWYKKSGYHVRKN